MSDLDNQANASAAPSSGGRTPKLAPAPVPQDTPWKATSIDGVASKPNFDSVESAASGKKGAVVTPDSNKDSKRSTTGKEKWVPYAPVVPVSSRSTSNDSGSSGGHNNHNSGNGNNGSSRNGRGKRQQNNGHGCGQGNSNGNGNSNSNSAGGNNSNGNSSGSSNNGNGNNNNSNGNSNYRQRRSQGDRGSGAKASSSGSNNEKRKNGSSGSRGSNHNRSSSKSQSGKPSGAPEDTYQESAEPNVTDVQTASNPSVVDSANPAVGVPSADGAAPVGAVEGLQIDDAPTERGNRSHGRSNYGNRPGSSSRRSKDNRYGNQTRHHYQGGYVHNGMQYPVLPMPQIMPPRDFMYTADYMFSALVAQINHYFSVDNLCRDMFLRKNMNNDGLVPVKVIADFNRVKTMTPDHTTVFQACRNAVNIEVVGNKVRAAQNWERWLLPESERLPAGLEGVPETSEEEKLKEPKEPKFQVEQAVPFVPKSASS